MDESAKKIEVLQGQMRDLQARVGSSTVDRNIGTLDKKVMEDAISDAIIEITWNRYFYFHTFFEEIGVAGSANNGWSLNNSAAVGTGLDGSGVFLKTGAVSNDETFITKGPIFQGMLSYEQESRFRTSFQIDSVTSVNAFMGIGYGQKGFAQSHYGFRLENTVLYAVVSNGTTETTKAIMTVAVNNVIQVEARFYPGYKVEFYTSDAFDPATVGTTFLPILLPRGAITTTIPKGLVDNWITYHIETKSAAAKTLAISEAEYIQKRKVN